MTPQIADTISGLMLMGALLFVYFLPTVLAGSNGHRNVVAIFALNLLLGWTGLGWVGALVWALVHQPKEVSHG